MFTLIAAAIGAQIVTNTLMRLRDQQYDVILPEPEPPAPLTYREKAKRIRRRIRLAAFGLPVCAMLLCWILYT